MQDGTECGELLSFRGHTNEAGYLPEDGTLEIGDTTSFSCYLRGGAVTEVKRPKTVCHVSASASKVGELGRLEGSTVFWTCP